MPKNASQHTPSSKPGSRVTAGTNSTGKATKALVKSTKRKGDESSNEDSDGDENDGGEVMGTGKKGAIKLVWDDTLTWALITHINENAKIKKGLYPPPGQNPSTANGGGKPKSDFHAELARALFEDHEKYGTLFAQDKGDPARLSKWSAKIKNRINALEKKTRRYFNLMGETGQGMTREEDIDMATNSELTNKWLSIKASFPFYFEMLELIGQRPNKIHAGIGNSLAKVDINVIMGNGEEDPELTKAEAVRSKSPTQSEAPLSRKRSGSFRDLDDSDDDDKEATDLLASIQAQSPPDSTPNKMSVSRKSSPETSNTQTKSKTSKTKSAADSTVAAKKTAARPGSSTPVSKGKDKTSSKKLKFGDQFVEAITVEEQTRQKVLDVRLSQAELERVKLEGKIAAKRDKIRLKAEMQKLAMEQEHRERMAKIQQRQQWLAPGSAGPSHPRHGRDNPLVLGDDSKARPYAWVGDQENYWGGVPVVQGAPVLADPLADPLAMGVNANLGLGTADGMNMGLGDYMNNVNGQEGQW